MVRLETVLKRTMATASLMMPSPKSTAFSTGNLSGSIVSWVPWWATWLPPCQSRTARSSPAWSTLGPSGRRGVRRRASRRGRGWRSRSSSPPLPGSWSCRSFRKTAISWASSRPRRWWAAVWWWKRSHCRTRSRPPGPAWEHLYVVDEDCS